MRTSTRATVVVLVAITAWILAPAGMLPAGPTGVATATSLEQSRSVSAAPGTAEAAIGGPVAQVSPQTVCDRLDTGGQAVTAVTPAAPDTPLAGEHSPPFYAGTTLLVVFCNANGESAGTNTWSLADHDGYSIINQGGETYTIELAEQQTTLAFADLVEQRDPKTGFTIDVTVGAAVESELIDEPVPFDSQGAADTYDQSEERFLTAVADVEAATAAVNESAVEIRQQGIERADPSATLAPLSDAREEMNAAADKSVQLLYRAAFSASATTDALAEAETRRRAANASIAAALVTYQQTVADQTAQHRSDIRSTLGLGFLPGLVVGALVGVLVPYRRKRKIDYDRKFTASTGGSRAFLVPLAVAVVALVVGIALLWLTLPIGLVIA